jgi:hypothetical protein
LGRGNQKQKKSKPNQPTADDGSDGSDDESGSDGEDESQDNLQGNADDVMETDHDGSLPNTSSALNPTHGPVACPIIPPLVGLNDAEYEFAVMDVYINAKSRGICRRRVCNEYFGNNKGMTLNSTH